MMVTIAMELHESVRHLRYNEVLLSPNEQALLKGPGDHRPRFKSKQWIWNITHPLLSNLRIEPVD